MIDVRLEEAKKFFSVVDFINILRAPFSYESKSRSFI